MSFDRFDDCFLKITPQKNGTFSYQSEPCRYEPPISPRTERTRLRCPFNQVGYCDAVLENSVLGRVLTSAYPERIKNTLSEPSTSIVIRSEQQFHGMDRQRLAQRRHFYEVVSSGTPGDDSRFGIGCTTLHRRDRLGEYLGFVDLRQYYKESPLALGLLVEPGCVREDPNAFVIKGDYGPLFGAHSFRSTVYCMQDPTTIGATCAQMCAIMALGMLGDRGAEIKGSFTITFLAWLLDQGPLDQRLAEVDKTNDDGPLAEFDAAGLTPDKLRDVMRECNVGADWLDIDYIPPVAEGLPSSSDRMVTRIIEAYLHARFPVILAVDASAWKSGTSCSESETRVAHAVTLVGWRRTSGVDPDTLIVHDPGWKPFGERTLQRCLDAAREFAYFDKGLEKYLARNKYSLVVAREKPVKRRPVSCIRWLLRDRFESLDFRNFYLCAPSTNYRVFLMRRNSVFSILTPDAAERDTTKWFQSTIPASRLWCICTYVNDHLETAWLFDAEREQPDNFLVKVSVNQSQITVSVLDAQKGLLSSPL